MMHRKFLALLALLLCLALSVPALAAEGLSAFQNPQNAQPGAFSDVPSGSWYAAGVQAVSSRGIMNGTGKTSFSPKQTVSWAQAVAIAARIHAACNDGEIAETGGAWYEPYIAYATEAKLLPSTCPDGSAVTAKTITRQELAGLFANVLRAEDLPAINDQTIPDLNAVDAEFREAVEQMYAAGVFTGKNGGNFDPNGSATRAEIAVIVSRLLLPCQRVGHDSRVNPAMSNQMGNYYQGSLAVQSGDTVYYVYRNDDADEIGVTARKADGSMEPLFSSDRVPDNLYLGADGAFYFLWWEKLLRYDPAANEVDEVYAAKGKIDSFQFYDGKLYVLENYAGDPNYPDQWRYRFGYLENGQFKSLMDGITFKQETHMERLHLFGGKAWFLFGDNSYVSNDYRFYNYTLWSIDLATGEKGRAVDLDEFYMSEIAFDGATAYAFDGGDDQPMKIVRFSLFQPDLRETVLTLPEEATPGYRMSLISNGGKLYYFSPEARKLWQIGADGSMTLTAQATWGKRLFEYATITPQGVLFHDVTSIRLNESSVFEVRLPDGSLVNCADFLKLQ